ncbi:MULTISPECIES: RagB/SusD family nutrient uptake outer membrane protein [Chitinophagaceae]
MKKSYKYLILVVGVASITASCNKFLDKNPDNRTELNSPDKVRALLATAYPQASYQKMAELMSDNAADRTPLASISFMDSTFYAFGDYISDDGTQDSPTAYWSACYKAIASANAALDAIPHTADSVNYTAEKGEALVCRAYAHFMLATLYSKPYDPATAANIMGIPYVTKPEKVAVAKYERASLAENYANIEEDLEGGLPLIDDDNYSVPKFHFTKRAARAFATRFYLYKKEYQKAISYANDAFSSDATLASAMRNWNNYLSLTVNEFRQNYTNSTDNANLLLIEEPSLWARNYTGSRFGFTPSFYSTLFAASAVTTNGGRWLPSKFVYVYGQIAYAIPKWNEYFYAPDDPSYGYPYIMAPVLTTEELLFNRAEAKILLGQYDQAINDMNLYLSKRLSSYTVSDNLTLSKVTTFYGTDSKTAMIQMLLYMKRIEFIQEGMRWFDILRYGIKVVHKQVDLNQKTVATYTLDSTDNRRQWQLPQATITGGVTANPR